MCNYHTNNYYCILYTRGTGGTSRTSFGIIANRIAAMEAGPPAPGRGGGTITDSCVIRGQESRLLPPEDGDRVHVGVEDGGGEAVHIR